MTRKTSRFFTIFKSLYAYLLLDCQTKTVMHVTLKKNRRKPRPLQSQLARTGAVHCSITRLDATKLEIKEMATSYCPF